MRRKKIVYNYFSLLLLSPLSFSCFQFFLSLFLFTQFQIISYSNVPRFAEMMKVLENSSKHNTPKKQKTFQHYLPAGDRCYSCIHCRANLAAHSELISKSFQGSQGKAYLFNAVVNIGCGPAEERVLLTGLHAVADIYCEICKTTLGWKYEHAFESSQKYKEGKFIIELAHMVKDNGWDEQHDS
ncbi:hypothetical protein CRE_13268 [Caenorhabditis remanei]|uniref:Yippee domain-containing protein n=4 Tax=Caenorhabditis TaxID=6237 RepID=E3M8E5_CAERE|nr:hypothetical protein CRE_13268 [Caenorhabditis remanei]